MMHRYRYAVAIIAALLLFLPDRLSAGRNSDPYIPSILIVEDDSEADELERQGVIIWHRRADMALALVPRDLQGLSRLKGRGGNVRGRRAVPALDIARTYYEADRILSGSGLPGPYTGKGVVVGFCDSGFDPNHIAFRGTDGRSRVRRLVYYDEPAGIRKVMDSPDEIASWTTDNADMFHGTHVANIIAGGYRGNPYSGMAPDAEIVAATSKLYDAGILSACEDIVDYARSVGKPAVINLSLGSYNGPHDGSSLFCRYLDLIGEEAIVCIAAGNEADDSHSYIMDFSEESRSWRARLHSRDGSQFSMYGMTDVWSRDSRPVGVRALVYDLSNGTCVYESPAVSGPAEGELTLTSDSDHELARFIEGEIRVHGYVSDLNGRWVTEVEYDFRSPEPEPSYVTYPRARYELGLEFFADPGVHMDVNSDGQYSLLRVWPGYEYPGNDMSVSDIATGHNVVCVGMYNNRSSVPVWSGGEREVDARPLTVNDGSGYGTLTDGRVLPHTVAPGGFIVSASNSYYPAAHPERMPIINAIAEIDGRKYYWDTDAGTSMSTPFVAGTLAAWLEADPTLTVGRVLEILETTNTRDYPDSGNPRHGQGWFRPFDGLLAALAGTGVSAGAADAASPSVLITGDSAVVMNPSCDMMTVSVYSSAGSEMTRVQVSGPTGRVDLSGLPRGVYVITAVRASGDQVVSKFVR
ncbi:MAG: S8 family serine peptidase [Muribaculaceae bacterium]|nr:S8 family serine peptidase [Muribaculaceae bacterium]